MSAGATIDGYRRTFGSCRWRYFGPRALIEDNTVQSKATSLINLQGGYRLAKNLKLALDVFNLVNAADSDIDYFYSSRLPGEPLAGVCRRSHAPGTAENGAPQYRCRILITRSFFVTEFSPLVRRS